jgi:hypothetical protein
MALPVRRHAAMWAGGFADIPARYCEVDHITQISNGGGRHSSNCLPRVSPALAHDGREGDKKAQYRDSGLGAPLKERLSCISDCAADLGDGGLVGLALVNHGQASD